MDLGPKYLNLENRIAKDEKNLLIRKEWWTTKMKFERSWKRLMDINFLTMESLILAQDERWRRASYMQVERESLAC